MPKADEITRAWMRNASDEMAVAAGYRFDVSAGAYTVWWIERCCRLYEGEQAGEPLRLRSCDEVDSRFPVMLDDWEDCEEDAILRAAAHIKAVRCGEHVDWQYECVMRIFGWKRHSEAWGREVRRFRRAGVWVPKKNKKSPTLAAIGLYLFAGDGEDGQKIYSTAKDGRQAMISHQHAIEMVSRSPDLMADCRINRTTGQITHLPTSSFYRVVAGDNPHSQEGLNGSVMVDETHVVDRKLMKILKRAGISRSEPLHLEVSTAGNNPDGYGKEQFDYGKKVESGEFTDHEFFFQSYDLDPDTTDEELDRDLLAIGRKANPAWGHTIKEDEFVNDYNASKHSMTELADFKMYRLNLWQRSANPWLKASDWAKCRREFDESDLSGRRCFAGLDLSKTRDMSALMLVFPDDGAYWMLPYFWLPEVVARERNHLVPFLQWAADGFLTLTPGDTIDYGFIKGRFRELADLFDIRALGYDPKYADQLTLELEQGAAGPNGETIEEGTGVPRMPIGQTMTVLCGPTAEFERLVISGRAWHNGHPILAWQAGHVEYATDYNANKRPVKPKPNDVKKIDGIMAGVMALAVAVQEVESDMSVYCQRDVYVV